MGRPVCPRCGHHPGWRNTLRRVYGPSREGTALWGMVCPQCRADLKVPNARMMLIVVSGIFFGSQSSTLLLLGTPTPAVFWAAKLGLVLLFYVLATVIFLKLEPVA